ncbi:MAG: SDR family oxidoreductase [Chromatiales bacterium]|jgi:NAD(P)-dependent dehydrogenase (short-subunit alcohol dehydrogenase family)|nr:SDR family oxidoreductase [Chromatiales bacterium]
MSRRVAIITDANMHLGPDLARILASRQHDLVLGEPAPGLAEELVAQGAQVESVRGVADLSVPSSIATLMAAAIARFGRIDAACVRTGKIVGGDFLDATIDDFHTLVTHNLEAVFHVLKALLPHMEQAGTGQVVIVTSATGARAQPNSALYSTTRAAANMLVKNAALSVAKHGVTVNAIGTNYLDYPGFRGASGADDPDVRRAIEARVPIGRLGQPHEVAHFCASLLDGVNYFQTGQFFSLSGGWSD